MTPDQLILVLCDNNILKAILRIYERILKQWHSSISLQSEQSQNLSEWHFHLTVSHQICDFYKHFFNVVDIYVKNRHAARADIYFSSSAARERARRLHANQFGAALVELVL